MKVIYNNVIPLKGFKCVNLFGVLFARKGSDIDETTINHESIHTAQMKELAYIFFYIIYFFEWIFRLIFHTSTAYIGISFEREAYNNESNYNYLDTRKHYAQWRRS